MRHSIQFAVGGILFLLLAWAAPGQGDLAPAGPPGPVMKSLEQVEPRIDLATVGGSDLNHQYVISLPGSYYLSENLEITRPYGVRINTRGVILDLNGFNISRESGSGGSGIYVPASGATVRNGTIVGFDHGLHGPARAGLCEDLAVTGCASYGIRLGSAWRVVDCRAYENAGTGVRVGSGSSVDGCIAMGNQGDGINVETGSSVEGCSAYQNDGNGIVAGKGTTLINCSSTENGGNGISAGSEVVLLACNVVGNKGDHGIATGYGAVLDACAARDNHMSGYESYGISAGRGSTITGCSSHSNSSTNAPGTAYQGAGIFASYGSTVRGCTASNNEGDGIRVSQYCYVMESTCRDNGYLGDGAGIHATGIDNRIEANQVTDNDRGIDVDQGGNFIAHNTASGNSTNWVVELGNTCLVVYRTTAGAIIGDSGGTSPGSTDPNANYTY